MRESILIPLLILSLLPELTGQKFISLNDQFPFARARCAYQDDYGFMWFGTIDGLVKYDGISTRIYRNTPQDTSSLPGQEVHAIIQNSDTTLLLGFQEYGLAQFNRNTGRCAVISLIREEEPLTVTCLLITHDSALWVGTDRGLFALEGEEVRHFARKPGDVSGLQNNYILSLYEDEEQNLWVGTRGGMHLLDRYTETFEHPGTNSTFPTNLVIDIGEDNDGRLWASERIGPNRLSTWDPENRQFAVEERFVRDGEFRFDFDAKNVMWISSRGRGLYRVDKRSEVYFDPSEAWKHGFWGLGTFDVLHDRYRNIWVIAEEVFQRPGHQKGFRNIKAEHSIIHSVFADDRYIWYCSDEPKRWDRETGETELFLENFQMREIRREVAIKSQSRIYHFEEWGEDLVMSTTRNVIVWDRSLDRFTDLPTRVGGPLRDLVIDSNGVAWIAINQRLPVRMSLPDGHYTRVEALLPSNTTHTVAMSRDGVQWWGNRVEGVFSYNVETGKLVHYEPDPENPDGTLSSFDVHDILCHSDGSVWVGTKLGLDRINPEKQIVTNYKFDDQHVNTQITSLLEDTRGNLWMGTKDGLLFIDPKADSLRRFTRADGLVNTVFTQRACYRDNDGVLYFGGDAGIDYFHPDDIGTNPVSPDLYIKSVVVNNVLHTESTAGECLRTLSLSHSENFIEIELIGIHLASPGSVTYAYRLPSQSDNWIELGSNRVISLAQVPPGEYVLEARAANADGVWSQPRELLSIAIRPPFWQTAWFIGLMTILVACGIYSLYRFRVSQIRRAERVRSKLTKRIAEIEMKALRAQMNPHFLFNSLNSMRLLIDKGDNDEAKRYLTKYSQLIRQILDNSRKKLIRLDEELKTLRLYLELERMRFKNFKYEIHVEEDAGTDFLEVPPLLLQPYVENALWHGLMNKQEGEKILQIRVNKNSDAVVVTIEDNGIGREQARKLNSRNRLKKESLGIRISKERLEFLKELYGAEVDVEITDLEQPTGTRVMIRLPVGE